VRYVVSFAGSASAIPLVAYIHRTTGELTQLFLILGALSFVILLAAVTLPGGEKKAAPAAA
jgi:hypothetical protein